MKNRTDRHIGIRITDADLHYKLHYIAHYEGRSANGQILYLIRKCIQAFEADHSEIQPPENPTGRTTPLS